jgi:hypothetical protein
VLSVSETVMHTAHLVDNSSLPANSGELQMKFFNSTQQGIFLSYWHDKTI